MKHPTRPHFDRAVDALEAGDTLVITTLDRLGRSTQNMLAFAEELRGRGAGLRVFNMGGGDVDTVTPMGSMLSAPRVPERGPGTKSGSCETGTQPAMGELPDHVTETPHVA